MSTLETGSYWCYRCSRFVRVLSQQDSSVVCPDCETGFVEAIDNPLQAVHVDARRRRIPAAAAMYMIGQRSAATQDQANTGSTIRRIRRIGVDRGSPFNPVVVLRGPSDSRETRRFELYYDDGGGSGLRPLPPSVSEFLLGSGFDRLLEQLSQIELNGVGRFEHPPASKSAIEAMPTIEIGDGHISTHSHCAVCKEEFELGSEAREMPCKHIYHSDCILPWLSLRNSCPVCRHELPADVPSVAAEPDLGESGQARPLDENVGLTIWRLPGGGFAVGRFSGGRGRDSDRELPVVYTEVDGGFNNGGAPRRVSWAARGRGGSEGGGFGRAVRNLFTCFRGIGSSGSSSSGNLDRPAARRARSVLLTSRRRRTWSLELNSRSREW